MPGLIRRALLIGGAALGVGGLAFTILRRSSGRVDESYGPDPEQRIEGRTPAISGAATVVVVFGDGFLTGIGRTADLIRTEVVEAGIAMVAVTVRSATAAPWPVQADDALAAVVHLQRYGPEMSPPLDPSRMVLMGEGAGAYLAVTTALSLVEVGLPPRGVVSLYGPMDFSTLDADMATLGRPPARAPADVADSPESRLLGFAIGENRPAARALSPLARLDRLREPLPPILIRHGDADPVVADLQANRLREAWAAADPAARIDYALVPGAGHGGEAFTTGTVQADVLAFLLASLA